MQDPRHGVRRLCAGGWTCPTGTSSRSGDPERRLLLEDGQVGEPGGERGAHRPLHAFEPVWSKNSCGRSVVELQEAPETLAASHGPVLAHLLARKEEEVALPLVVPLAVEVFDVRAQRGS